MKNLHKIKPNLTEENFADLYYIMMHEPFRTEPPKLKHGGIWYKYRDRPHYKQFSFSDRIITRRYWEQDGKPSPDISTLIRE